MPLHEKFMRRCLELAQLGLSQVSPNPMVGCVIVHKDQIIGEGYHEKYGQAHAEVNAVNDAKANFPNAADRFREATIYVSLEPCAHFGKTPPCADLIIQSQFKTVVIACRDPFSEVNGKGIEKLKQAGIEVIVGVLEKEALFINRRFFTRIQKQRPYIILKWAQTQDGFFSPTDGKQRWISNEASRKLVHKWRTEEDAVLVGKNTALVDNPQLNARLWEGKTPLRILIDKNLELPQSLHLFDQNQNTLVFNALKTETVGKIKYIQLKDFENYLPQMLSYQLYLFDVQSIIIEGGVKMLQLFISANLWDEARIFISDEHWNDGLKAPLMDLSSASVTPVLTNQLKIIYNK